MADLPYGYLTGNGEIKRLHWCEWSKLQLCESIRFVNPWRLHDITAKIEVQQSRKHIVSDICYIL